MRSALVILLVLSQLVWWDLVDKVNIIISYDRARQHIDRDTTFRAKRLFALARFSVGLRLIIDPIDFDLPRRMIIVANHQSLIDIVALMAMFDRHIVRFVAKRELRKGFPAVSGVLRIQRHALIPRDGNFALAMREIDRLGGSIADMQAAAIFAEGTRSRSGEVLPFHAGAVRRLHAAQHLPLVAVAAEGGWRFADMAGLRKIRPGDQFRVRVEQIYPPTRSKRELVSQISDAEHRIRSRVASWRSEC